MSGTRGRFIATGLVALATVATLVLAGCGSSSAAAGPKGCKKIGVLLPESDTSSRWEGKDHPLLQQQISADLPGAQITITNANGNQDTQLSQAEADLTAGDCILVVAAHDSSAAASIVQEAHKSHVPVIAYDRLINDTSLDYYVSFDNVAVGVAQGNYIQANYQSYVTANGNNNIAFIDGSQTDNNALLFSKGVHSVLDPLITAGTLKKVYETFTPGWDNPTAQTEMEAALTSSGNKLAIAYVANDGMAGTVIAALTSAHLNGKVLVTGQDATVAGIQQILLGNQSMTVYKAIVKEASATAQLVAALSNGTSTASIATSTTAYNGTNIPSALEPVIAVDKTNIATTVLADGFVTKSDICQGVPAGTDGIC
jgi:D-xylose transport system substrate-binding protein